MSLLYNLEAKDKKITTQFSRFVLVGGVSTIINYTLFYILYIFFSANYLVASFLGYITGMLFGYLFNARLTFGSKPGLSIIPYFFVYLFSLITSLGVLKFSVASAGLNPIFANIISIAFSTTTNFLGSRYIAFNENFKLPAFTRSKIFVIVLTVKFVFSFLFASDFMTQLFIPFVKYFIENPMSNPYQHFFEIGAIKSFPYPPLMLYIASMPYILFGLLGSGGLFDLLFMRLSLLAADVVIFYVLYMIFRGREKYTLMLYWASPVVFYITYIHGQLDIIPVALLFVSTYFLINKKYTLSALLLGAGLATKSFIFIVLPIYFIYLLKKDGPLKNTIKFFTIAVTVYGLLLLPYIFSYSFIRMVFFAEEQLRLLNLSINFTSSLVYYIVPAAYFYILFKALSFKKITRDILFVFLGMILTLLVTFITPARGWYMWAIPFVVYFFVKERRNMWIYAAFNISYLFYFLFVPDSDVFNVFQLIAPSIALNPAPYNYLLSIGLPANVLVNLFFTALTSTLIYTSYLIYSYGVKNSLLFQEKNGIPIIGISGDSGAGKTTLASHLSDLFGWNKVTVVYGDDIHKWERADRKWEKYTHLNPIGNRIYLNYKQLKKLKMGHSVTRRHYSHKTGKFTNPVLVKPKDFIISEGLHALFINESNYIYEIKIYMDPDPYLKVLWKLKRDIKLRNYRKVDVMKQLEKRKKDAKKFVIPQKYYSDIIVSYKPLKKIDLSGIDKEVPLYLQLDVKNDIPIEDFIDAIAEFRSLKLYLEYPDHRFQRLTIKGSVSKIDIERILDSLSIDYESYEISRSGLKEGLGGIVQVISLYCLNERLKALSGTSEE